MTAFAKRLKDCYFNMDNIPEEFLDPVTYVLMENPVTMSDGHVYDKTTAEKYFKKQNPISPHTSAPFVAGMMPDAHRVRSAIISFIEKQEELARPWLAIIQSKDAEIAALKTERARLAEENRVLTTKVDASQSGGWLSYFPFFSTKRAFPESDSSDDESEEENRKRKMHKSS